MNVLRLKSISFCALLMVCAFVLTLVRSGRPMFHPEYGNTMETLAVSSVSFPILPFSIILASLDQSSSIANNPNDLIDKGVSVLRKTSRAEELQARRMRKEQLDGLKKQRVMALVSRSSSVFAGSEDSYTRNNMDQRVVSIAESLIGSRYRWGGSSPSAGFDCSGFVKYVFAQVEVSMPRSSYGQYSIGTPITRDALKPGDLVFFSTYASGASHVGIYIGGGRFVHAENPAQGVTISSLDGYFAHAYVGARRILE